MNRRFFLIIVGVVVLLLLASWCWIGAPVFVAGSYHPTTSGSPDCTCEFRDGVITVADSMGEARVGTYHVEGWSVVIVLDDSPDVPPVEVRSTPFGLVAVGSASREVAGGGKDYLFRRKFPWE